MHNSKREKMQLKVSDLFIFAIRRCSHVNGLTDEFKVTGYTTFKVYDNASDNSVKYYANEFMNSQKRYDYAMIEFVSDRPIRLKRPSTSDKADGANGASAADGAFEDNEARPMRLTSPSPADKALEADGARPMRLKRPSPANEADDANGAKPMGFMRALGKQQ